MANLINYKEASKKNWAGAGSGENIHFPGIDHINMASLQRIADATEKMAVNQIELQRQYDWMKGERDTYREWYMSRDKTISNLRGQITKLKNKLKAQNENT